VQVLGSRVAIDPLLEDPRFRNTTAVHHNVGCKNPEATKASAKRFAQSHIHPHARWLIRTFLRCVRETSVKGPY
jgi:hypothetical protein